MANTTFDSLTALTGANAAPGDKLLIDDVSVTATPTERSITLGELLVFVQNNPLFDVDTVIATNASYAKASTFQAIILNNASTDVDVTFSGAITTGTLLVIYAQDGGALNHSVVLTGQTWDGTNTTAVFNAAEDYLVAFALSPTRVLVLVNNSVTFSA